uniref:Homeobox domain-containing protein n=1 Tax=Xiphophorus couchianus TaxID=32473 RepID=A0A3B5MQA8_9TELE
MSSRRKSSTPCMVRVVSDLPDELEDPEDVMMNMEKLSETNAKQDPQQKNTENPDKGTFSKQVETQNLEPLVSEKKQPRGYKCKYCPFLTQNLSDFKEHVDSSHPNVILNPLYLCAVCNFNTKKFDSLTEHNESQHPGETNFKFKRIQRNNQTILEQTIEGKDNSAESLNINGTVIIPEPTMLQGLSHVTPMLKRPPNFNSVPKIAVPLNTTKYNPSLDDNLTLISSFNKFPYPTHAELSWLTAASKHPEEQIKVWFTTQRLKQGITWSPEEVEEARKKMFNGSIPPAHHTFTSPISHPSAKLSKQPIVHTTVEHPGQVRTTVSSELSIVSSTNSSAGVTIGSSHNLKRSLTTHLASQIGPEAKRPIMSVRTPAKIPSQIQGFPLEGKKLKEHQSLEINSGYPRGDKLVSPLTEANGTSRLDGKLFTDQTCPTHNNGIIHLDGGDASTPQKQDFNPKSSVMTQFPLLERMKGKTAKQLKVLEENFLRNSFPTHSDVDNLAATTRLSHQEIDSWFVERRALRDNLEQALLNSMGEKQLHPQQHQTLHRSLALLKDDFAQTRWPSPEELHQLEGRKGLARSELARWFTDTRLQSVELTELFHNNGINGGQGQSVCSPEKTSSSIIQRCQEGAVANNNKVLELELGWLLNQRSNSLNNQQHTELQDQFAGRYFNLGYHWYFRSSI